MRRCRNPVQEREYPDHFLEVEIGDVARHSAGLLLNRDAVRDYISEVCPVAMSNKFPFASKVEGLFDGAKAPLTIEVLLEGDPYPVERPHGEAIRLSPNKAAEFTDFQAVRIPSTDGNGDAAVGWVAHSPYLGAIPKEQRIRGIRVRLGNIQIGGDAVFDSLYTEERFNRWCVGELHILDSRIIPNARRDYFQPGVHLRHLENRLAPVLREISTRCRRESTIRNSDKKALSALCNIENLHSLAASGYLTDEDSTGLVREAFRKVQEVRKSLRKGNLDTDSLERLDTVEELLTGFSGQAKPQQVRQHDSFGDCRLPEGVWRAGSPRALTRYRKRADRNGFRGSVQGGAKRVRHRTRPKGRASFANPSRL